MHKAAIVTVCAVLAIAWATIVSDPVDNEGLAAIHQGIVGSSDCGWLREHYVWADANHERAADQSDPTLMEWTRRYMEAADGRMVELGCN